MSEYINPYRLFLGVHIPNWLARRSEVSWGAKGIYGRLAQFAGKNGRAWPFVSTLATEIGVGCRQTQRYIAELVEHHLIDVEDRRADGRSNVYRFFEHPWMHDDSEDSEGSFEADQHEARGQGTEGHTSGKTPPSRPISRTPHVTSVVGGTTPKTYIEKRLREENQEETHGKAVAVLPPIPKAAPVPSLPEREAGQEAPNVALVTENKGGVLGAPSPAVLSGGVDLEKLRAQNQAAARAEGEARMRESRKSEENLKNSKGRDVPISMKQAFRQMEAEWREGMKQRFPDVTVAMWGAKERGCVKPLVEAYGVQVAGISVSYVLAEWESISERFLRGRGAVPSLGVLSRFHDVLCIEAQRWITLKKLEDELVDWSKNNPAKPGRMVRAPTDLVERINKARTEMEAIRGVSGR